VRNSGFESEWQTREVRSIQARFGYSYLYRANVKGTIVTLLNTPHHKIFGSLMYSPVPKLRVIGSLNHESARTAQDDADALLTLDGYTSVNGRVSYAVARGLDAELSGSNLLDRNYQLYPGFPEAGRVVAVNLRYRY
jgi:outer membrane receptor protein involved in Fe transport